jgi:orotate phosphoribosyltransferase
VELIRAQGAEPAGVVIALDRMEKGVGKKSAVQEVQEHYGVPVISVVNLNDLLAYLEGNSDWGDRLEAVARYRGQYGI